MALAGGGGGWNQIAPVFVDGCLACKTSLHYLDSMIIGNAFEINLNLVNTIDSALILNPELVKQLLDKKLKANVWSCDQLRRGRFLPRSWC